MLHETRIHFQHRNVKTQFFFCRVAAQFNERPAVDAAIAIRLHAEPQWRGRR